MNKKYSKLIKKASPLAKPKKHNEFCTTAYVGCALLTDKGNVYTGVSIDAACGIGFCAEHSAIAQMITNKETKIKAIVAINENKKIIPPCGRCRELMYQINNKNLNTYIIMEKEILKLKNLLNHRWQES